jgi:riboflavin kinase/FMN adenylyltransferase
MKRTGKVIHGAGRGKGLGFPTLNVDMALDLPFGVYPVAVFCEQKKYSGVMNWGARPTFGEEAPTVEVFLLDGSGDFYGRTVELEVGPRLREVRRFAGPEELQKQIAEDVRRAREFFQTGTL